MQPSSTPTSRVNPPFNPSHKPTPFPTPQPSRNYTSHPSYLPSATPTSTPTFSSDPLLSLREHSCRGGVAVGEDGSYSFQTTMPASYGPPRHIVFTIEAPGYAPLTTRMYFDIDTRLQSLTNGQTTGRFMLSILTHRGKGNLILTYLNLCPKF